MNNLHEAYYRAERIKNGIRHRKNTIKYIQQQINHLSANKYKAFYCKLFSLDCEIKNLYEEINILKNKLEVQFEKRLKYEQMFDELLIAAAETFI